MNASASSAPASSRADPVNRVLFVDDDPAMREANLQTLELGANTSVFIVTGKLEANMHVYL